MDKFLRILSCIALLSALTGCVGPLPTEMRSPEILAPTPDKVKVVFMRTSSFEAALDGVLFEVIDSQLNFVGALENGTKIVYETTPGQKVFMGYGRAADFMLGNLAGGKIYYSIVRPVPFTGGMIPTPVKANSTKREVSMESPEFASWVRDTRLIAPTAEARYSFNQAKARYQDIYTLYWAKFQRKTSAEKAERTLNPQDGVGVDGPSVTPLVVEPQNVPVPTVPPTVPRIATPASPSLPANSETIANKLRELSKLYKEGVLTLKEYETKKHELLKAM